ncbi:hypothetical protein Tco_0064965 [Tanacetum coccineum]
MMASMIEVINLKSSVTPLPYSEKKKKKKSQTDGTEFQVDTTQSTRVVLDRDLNKGKTSSKVEPDTDSLILTTIADIQAMLEDSEASVSLTYKDDPKSSKSKKFVDASDSESSLCFETFKTFENYMPITERQLVRNLQNISKVLYAQVAEDNGVDHEEAVASYADLRAIVEGFATEADNNRNNYDIAINNVMGTVDQINGERIEEKTAFLKDLIHATVWGGENSEKHVVVWQNPPSYTKGEQLSIVNTTKEPEVKDVEKEPEAKKVDKEPKKPTGPVIDVTPLEQPESLQATPKADRGKGKMYQLIEEKIQAHLDKEEKLEKAAKEARLLEMNKFELIEAKELRKKKIDQYRWITSSRLKPETITEIYIHPNTKPIIITVYRGNDRRNFEVNNPFKFGDFRVAEWDKLGPVIKKKKNKVVGELMTSLGKKYHRLKVILGKIRITPSLLAPRQVLSLSSSRKRKAQELEHEVCIPGLECNRSLPEGVSFVNNLVIELPENGFLFIDVFGDEASQRMSDIHKVDVDTLLTYLVMYLNVSTPANQRLCLSLRSFINSHLDNEKLKSKKVKLEAVGYTLS